MLSLELIGDESGSGSECSDSVTESQNSCQIPVERNRVDRSFKSWKFLDTIPAYVLACELQERQQMLIEHFQTRTTHDRPNCVLSVTIFEDLKPLILAQAASGL